MSADGSIKLTWGDGEHSFRLGIGQMRELQENVNKWRVGCGIKPVGPNSLVQMLASTDAWPDDVHEIIRLGLIGAGMKTFEALTLVKRYVDDRPLAESTIVAHVILLNALVGVPDDPVGKTEAEKTANGPATMIDSSSPPSTASVLQ